MTTRSRFLKLLAVATLVAAPSLASAQSWTQWTAGSVGSFSGTLLGSTVTFAGGNSGGQLFNGTDVAGTMTQAGAQGNNYFNPPNAYNQGGLTVPGLGLIQFIGASGATRPNIITFSSAVINPYFAFVSVGQPNLPVTYTFNAPFTVLSNDNCATPTYWSCGSYSTGVNSLTGSEFSGTIRFLGTFNSITFSTNPDENWHGLTVGADSVVPEPATMSLLAMGLVGMAAARRRGKRSA
jgi:hypothetical protein